MQSRKNALLLLTANAVVSALPRHLQEEDFSPKGPALAPDGVPECEMQDGPYGRSENMVDTFMGPGTCDYMISSGQYTCARNFCPECNQNLYCDKTCGFCESTVDEVVDCDEQFDASCSEITADCSNDEAARAAADPFQNPLSPFTQGCDPIAENGFCEDESYIALGVTSFCCASCQARADEQAGGDVCDFMAIANNCGCSCVDDSGFSNYDCPTLMAMGVSCTRDLGVLTSTLAGILVQDRCPLTCGICECPDSSSAGDLATLCAQPCSVAVVANYAACMKDPTSDMAPYAATLEPIVEGCSQLNGTDVNVFGDIGSGRFCFSGQVYGCFHTGHPEIADNVVSCQDVFDQGICAGVDIIAAAEAADSATTWTLPDNFADICPDECGDTDSKGTALPAGSGH